VLFRLLSAAVILPVFLWALFQEPVGFRLFIMAALLLGYEEYRRIMAGRGLRFSPWLGLCALVVVLLPPALGAEHLPAALAPVLLRSGSLGLAFFFMVAALWRVSRADLEQGLLRFYAELGGLVYLGLLGLHLLKLHALPNGPWWCLLVFWYAWVYDSAALFAGKSFGKTPFSPLSPSKTWEGFWGGVLGSAVLSALILPHWIPTALGMGAWGYALLSVPASVLAQAGDLFESMVKRFAGVKDSSGLIPAQGGFLDKMDSSLFVAPLVYFAATALVSLPWFQ
jgi:phosphatidate cytidylyltransferase